MSKLTISWKKVLEAESLKRSSHSISAYQHRLFILGGELEPRQPVENQVVEVDHIISPSPNIQLINATESGPAPRVGGACATIHGVTIVFGGRGGSDMTPLVENAKPAGLWSLSHTHSWEFLAPLNTENFCPEPRSYHAMTSDNDDLVYLHAGCPDSERLADLWSFSVSSREWTRLSHGPGAPRGGTSIAYCPETKKVFRFGGFDGKTEIGGTVDVYDPQADLWSEKEFLADGKHGPLPRSVAGLIPVNLSGRPFLISLFGEGSPSNLGHAVAGKFFGDVWAWDIQNEKWYQVEATSEQPQPRGWFGADVFDYRGGEIVIHGGLGETNERFGDIWTAKISEAQG